MPPSGEPPRRRRRSEPLSAFDRLQLCAVTAIVAWGVLAFGAVYAWAYQPLAAACALCGVSALVWRRPRVSLPRAVVVALTTVVIAVLLQEVRIPTELLQRVSPATVALLARYDVPFALQGATSAHALSIDPARTWTGVLLLVCLGMFWIGLTGVLDSRLTVRVTQAVVAIGFVVALIAIGFSRDASHRVYGFWQPQFLGAPFGPFVNRNHYAGWMLMSTLAGFGYFGALLSSAALAGRQSWRQRVIWLSTPSGSRLIFVGAALVTMTVSVLVSMSRSGITCLAIGFATIVAFQARRAFEGWARTALVSGLIVFAVGSVAWVGTDALVARFGTWQDDSLEGRVAAWRDASAMVRQFPLTGTGLNTFGVAMLFYQTSHLQELYVEAHNDYLQLAAEGGLLVGLPVVMLIVTTSAAVRRRFRETIPGSTPHWIRLGAVVGLIAAGMQESIDFSLQMPGNAALFCVLAAIALHRTDRTQPA